jgi:hypothetical protein
MSSALGEISIGIPHFLELIHFALVSLASLTLYEPVGEFRLANFRATYVNSSLKTGCTFKCINLLSHGHI